MALVQSLLSTALASTYHGPAPEPDEVDLWGTNLVERPIGPAVAEAPLVFEAVVLSTEPAIYLSSAGGSSGSVIHLQISKEMKGHVASGFVDLWADTMEHVASGQRLILVGGPKTMQLTSMVNQDRGWFAHVPYYQDMVVPLWQDSVILDSNPYLADLGVPVHHACFADGTLFWSPDITDGRYCSEASWNSLVAYVEAEVAAAGAEGNFTISGKSLMQEGNP